MEKEPTKTRRVRVLGINEVRGPFQAIFSNSFKFGACLQASVLLQINIVQTSIESCYPRKMPVRIRLQRFGRKNLPFYRIVVADSRCPRDGRFIENVGTYNPIPSKFDATKEITANGERVNYWLSVGAQPSDRVAWLFGKVGLMPPLPIRVAKYPGIPKPLVKVLKAEEAAAKKEKAQGNN